MSSTSKQTVNHQQDALIECLKPWLEGNHQEELTQILKQHAELEMYTTALHHQIDTVWDAHMSEHRMRLACENRLIEQDETIQHQADQIEELNRMVSVLMNRLRPRLLRNPNV